MPEDDESYAYDLARDEEGHILIEVTCKACGGSGIVSVADGSLRRWQARHDCDKPNSTPMVQFPSGIRVQRKGP
jgi:hypothetical protein